MSKRTECKRAGPNERRDKISQLKVTKIIHLNTASYSNSVTLIIAHVDDSVRKEQCVLCMIVCLPKKTRVSSLCLLV